MPAVAKRIAQPDLAAIGYPAVRGAFNEVLHACAEKLTRTDIEWACEILSTGELDDDHLQYLIDVGLYSFARNQFMRPNGKRPIDRIAKSVSFKGDALKAAMLRAMPQAFFSVFEVEDTQEDGVVVLRDLLAGGRPLHLMDIGLRASASKGALLALRVVDLGPWHIGFGIAVPLRRSEAAAIMLATVPDGGEPGQAKSLHELVYGVRLHGGDLVSAAIEPLVMALSMAVDVSGRPLVEIVDDMRRRFADGPVS